MEYTQFLGVAQKVGGCIVMYGAATGALAVSLRGNKKDRELPMETANERVFVSRAKMRHWVNQQKEVH